MPPVSPELLAGALADTGNTGRPGTVTNLPIPGRRPRSVVAVGIGDGDRCPSPRVRRDRGAPRADARRARRPPAGPAAGQLRRAPAGADEVRAAVEAALLAGYRFREHLDARIRRGWSPSPSSLADATDPAVDRGGPRRPDRRRVGRLGPRPGQHPEQREEPGLAGRAGPRPARRRGRTSRSPSWGLTSSRAGGFGGVLAVGGGSATPPRVIVVRLPAAVGGPATTRCWSARASPSTPAGSRSSPTPACGR